VADLSGEDRKTQDLYGLDREETRDFGRSCLLARRLLEQGVRFVQLFSGGAFGSPRINWDGHEDVKENHTREAARIDRPVAALLTDLRRRGMLGDTLVLFTTEFGRTPFTQSKADVVGTGRDHNPSGFSVWLAGAGLRPGTAHGSTDDVGWKAAEGRVTWPDFHATVLKLLGIDHTKLTSYHNGIQRRLTNVHGEVIDGILA
jgi:membrane-anchored protein YejM (alkaline phosphatase superfamily)